MAQPHEPAADARHREPHGSADLPAFRRSLEALRGTHRTAAADVRGAADNRNRSDVTAALRPDDPTTTTEKGDEDAPRPS